MVSITLRHKVANDTHLFTFTLPITPEQLEASRVAMVNNLAERDKGNPWYVDKVLGWWRNEVRLFDTPEEAFQFVIDLYEENPKSILKWSEPTYVADFNGTVDTGVLHANGKTASVDALKVATLASKLARKHLDGKRTLKKADLDKLQADMRRVQAMQTFTFEDGVQERKS